MVAALISKHRDARASKGRRGRRPLQPTPHKFTPPEAPLQGSWIGEAKTEGLAREIRTKLIDPQSVGCGDLDAPLPPTAA